MAPASAAAVGIVCCVDVALATPDALFGITEVRVGVAPTPISTHMVERDRAAPHAPLRADRRAVRCRRGGAHRPGARSGARPTRWRRGLAEVLDAILLGAPGRSRVTKLSFLGANGLLLDEREMEMLAHEGWTQRQSARATRARRRFARNAGRGGTRRRSNHSIREETMRRVAIGLFCALSLAATARAQERILHVGLREDPDLLDPTLGSSLCRPHRFCRPVRQAVRHRRQTEHRAHACDRVRMAGSDAPRRFISAPACSSRTGKS